MVARDVARLVLRRVEQGEAFAALALAGALDDAHLAGPDRALVTELVYGVLRHRTRLDRALAAHAARGLKTLSPAVMVALRVGAYQLIATRVPPHAAVDDAVAAVRAAADDKVAGFTNAVLRALATRGEPPPPPASDAVRVLEEVHSLPRWLGVRLVAMLGKDEAEAAGAAFNQPAPVTLRVALSRTTRAAVAEAIVAERPGARVDEAVGSPEALLVRGAGAPETLSVFQAGLCTVQDLGAQLVARLLGAAPGERILDACAGVGGKAAHVAELGRMAQAAHGGAAAAAPLEIHAADSSRRKLDLGDDSARRLGLNEIRGFEVDLTDAAAIAQKLAPSYDRVLLDAPCSGLGVLRRHPEAKWRRRPADVVALAALQAKMLQALAPLVRPGGVLVYSVCTMTAEEGPAQIAAFVAAHPEFHLDGPPLTTWPHRDDADAFFAQRLRRQA
jgi:16S rRNA (cytosine967-C5)-methyltransferase